MNDHTTKDVVADLPRDLAIYKRVNGELPKDIKYEKGYYCVWDNRYFVHTRATLPLKDINKGIGFGLWVEVKKEDFDRYKEAENDDEKYKNFEAEGFLANEWPGFQNILGIRVKIKTVKVDEKINIWDVFIDKPRDPLFEVALRMQVNDSKTYDKVRNLIEAYVSDMSKGLL